MHIHILSGALTVAELKQPIKRTITNKSSPQKLPRKLPRKLPDHFLAISNQLFVRHTFVIIQYIYENIEQIYTVL